MTFSKTRLLRILGTCAVLLLAILAREAIPQNNFIAPIPSVQTPEADTAAIADTLAQKSAGGQNTKDEQNLFEVVRVIDGDTIEVQKNGTVKKVRFIGIDTPETVDPRKSVQCFGKEASAKATELLLGKRVRLETDATQDAYDRYGRLLAYAYLPNGVFFNSYMIEEGYAHEYTYELPYRYQKEFKAAEARAREAGKGLWNPAMCNGKK